MKVYIVNGSINTQQLSWKIIEETLGHDNFPSMEQSTGGSFGFAFRAAFNEIDYNKLRQILKEEVEITNIRGSYMKIIKTMEIPDDYYNKNHYLNIDNWNKHEYSIRQRS